MNGPLHWLVDSAGLKPSGPDQCLIENHGTTKRRSWKTLHLGVAATTGRIVAATLTDRDRDDAAEVAAPLDQIQGPMASFTGDGAYDRPTTVYAAVHERHPAADVIVPPRTDAVPSDTASTAPSQRDRHIQVIAKIGRRAWRRDSG